MLSGLPNSGRHLAQSAAAFCYVRGHFPSNMPERHSIASAPPTGTCQLKSRRFGPGNCRPGAAAARGSHVRIKWRARPSFNLRSTSQAGPDWRLGAQSRSELAIGSFNLSSGTWSLGPGGVTGTWQGARCASEALAGKKGKAAAIKAQQVRACIANTPMRPVRFGV